MLKRKLTFQNAYALQNINFLFAKMPIFILPVTPFMVTK